MGRPPSSGGPAFRFLQAEVGEMEARLQQLNNAIPHRNIIQAFVDKFTASAVRAGKIFASTSRHGFSFLFPSSFLPGDTRRPHLIPLGKILPAGADEQLAGSFRINLVFYACRKHLTVEPTQD